MPGLLRPVLTVPDPAAALAWFGALPGVATDATTGEATCGDLTVAILGQGQRPPALRDMPFDHLALRTGDVDALLATVLAAGATLDAAFTPNGPREIEVFWDTGVRFAFVVGPGGVPVELCARRGDATGGAAVTGLDHLGLRARDSADTAARLAGFGAVELARYSLPGPSRAVDVRFLQESNLVWEVFDEDPPARAAHPGRWAGVLA